MVRGCAGIVTSCGFRDPPEIAVMPFALYRHRPAAPISLTLHRTLDINVPIGYGRVAVFPGDAVVGNREGVFVIPANMADEMAAEPVKVKAFGNFMIGEVLKRRSTIGLSPPTVQQSKNDSTAWV